MRTTASQGDSNPCFASHRATRTPVAARYAHRAGAPGTAVAAGAAEQSARTTVATRATSDSGSTTVTAVAEPARRATVATGEASTAVADQAAVAPVTCTAEAGTFVLGVGIAVAEQDARVGVVGGAVTDEEPQDAAWLPARR